MYTHKMDEMDRSQSRGHTYVRESNPALERAGRVQREGRRGHVKGTRRSVWNEDVGMGWDGWMGT